jgi:hypothetical protein
MLRFLLTSLEAFGWGDSRVVKRYNFAHHCFNTTMKPILRQETFTHQLKQGQELHQNGLDIQ